MFLVYSQTFWQWTLWRPTELDIHCAVLDKGEPLVDGFQVSKYFSFGYSLRKLGLRETRGGSEKLSLVVAHQHELLQRTSLSLADLMEFPWILPLGSATMRANILQYFNEQGVGEPQNLVESVSILTNMNVIAQSNFIGCMSSIVAEQMVSLNVLAKLPFPEIGDDIDVGYSKRKNEELTPACLKFITCLQAEG